MGGDLFQRVTSRDLVTGRDGRPYLSDQATIWRWREAFQHDFAARMGWTVRPYSEANHAPKVVVNDLAGTSPLQVDVEVGQPLTLDAAGTTDPDGHELRYRWFHYPEAGFVPGARLAGLSISDANTSRATITATTACRPTWMPIKAPCPSGIAHVILAVTDAGTPSLTSYRRVIVNVRPAARQALEP